MHMVILVDNQFTQGSKDYLKAADLRWSLGSTKDKNDIVNAAAVIIGDFLYFYGDRSTVNGDAQIGFWFYLNGTAPAVNGDTGDQDFEPEHAVGDLLIISNFTGGGNVADSNHLRMGR